MRKQSSKALIAVAAAAAGILMLSACSSGTPQGGTAASSAAPGSISLRMTTWTANENQLKLFGQIADAYKQTHPEIKDITFDSLPSADYTTTLTTQIAGGDAPDLAWIYDTDAMDFVSSSALAPLSDTLQAASGYNFSDLSQSATALWTSNNQLYAYPFSTSPFIIFSNDSLLQQAGLPTAAQMKANGNWTWDGIMQAAAQVNAKTGQGGLYINNFNYSDWTYLSTIWNGFGAAPWSADGKSCTFASTQMQSAFTFINNAIVQQNAMPGPGTTVDFPSGGAAFEIAQISAAGLLAKATFNWDLNSLPNGQNGQPANVIGQAGLGVIASGKNVQEAQQFLAFFTNPDNAKQLAAYFPPPRTSLQTADVLAAANPVLSNAQLQTVVASLSSAVTRPGHVNQAQIAQAVKTALTPMWSAGADVPTILQNVCTAATPLLTSN